MESAEVSSQKSPYPPCPARSQLCDVTTETCTTSDSVDYRNPVKKEEPEDEGYLCDGISSHVGLIITVDQKTVKEEEPENDEFLYCEDCRSYFTNKCEVHGPALFIFDTPVPMGIDDRARQTLPPGLEVGMSDIPHAGLGVFNKGESIPLGAHFGPCEGDLVDREEAMNSGYSWVISKSSQCEEYIDAKREMHSNWMSFFFRYVNCARNGKEQNLVAFQYRGGIFYRCCQPIKTGQELLMWYEDDYGKNLGLSFDNLWKKKCSSNEMNDTLLQVFCSWCPLSYLSQTYLDNHIRRSHYQEYVKVKNANVLPRRQQTCSGTSGRMRIETDHCFDCGKGFNQPNNLNTHQCVHTAENLYHCSQWEKSFHESVLLQRDQSIHTREKAYRCSHCGKSFNSSTTLQRHRSVHTGEKPYRCSHCGKRFTYQSHLKDHERIHTGEKPYHCSHCGKSFSKRNTLQRHLRVHAEAKPYLCSLCGKSFTQQSDLQRHQRIHTEEKPYPCSQCGKRFTLSDTLRRHQYVHTGEKPYQCSECGKRFNHHSDRRKHQRIHTGERPYRCSVCRKSFVQQSDLRRHWRIHTGEKPYHCSECGKSFRQQNAFQTHQLVHTGEKPYHCSECGKSFNQKGVLRRHQRIHTREKPYRCLLCGKSFRRRGHLRQHQLVHTGEKLHHCAQCGKRFTYSNTFKKHKCTNAETTAHPNTSSNPDT